MLRHVIIMLAICGLQAGGYAIPYASRISVPATNVSPGANIPISYYLNEAGSNVSISVVDAANTATIKATFAGTNTQGLNTLNWNQTNNNAGGTQVTTGTVRYNITVTKNVASTYTLIGSNRSSNGLGSTALTTLFAGFRSAQPFMTTSQDSSDFGYLLALTSFNAPSHAAAAVLSADTSIADATDGFASRVLKAPWDATAVSASGGITVWGSSPDPDDPAALWTAGQAAAGPEATPSGLMYAASSRAATFTNADPSAIVTGSSPRGVLVRKEGANKFAYFTYGNSLLAKVQINDSTKVLTGTVTNVLSLTDTARYSKEVVGDASGNVYWVSRRNAATNLNGIMYRWNKAAVDATPGQLLTENQAPAAGGWAWRIQVPAADENTGSCAITPNGDVYLVTSTSGIYFVGNSATVSLDKTLGPADLVVSLPINPGAAPNVFGQTIRSDPAGNIIMTVSAATTAAEYGTVRIYSPGGNTTRSTISPLSQNTNIGNFPTAAQNWDLFR